MTRLSLNLMLLALLVSPAGAVSAPIERSVSTSAGDEIPLRVDAAEGSRRLLWLPSEFGITPRRNALAAALAAQGIEVWSPDLHAAWFLPPGRYSLNDVDPAAIASLIDAALDADGRPLFLMAAGRSVALALRAVRHWQASGAAENGRGARLAGLLAFDPRLYVATPQGGERANYLPVAGASNLPIYLLQPENSAGYWHVASDIEQLSSGGAAVFLHRLADAADGFYARPDFSPQEAALTARLPRMLAAAMDQLDGYAGTPAWAAAMPGEPIAPQRPGGDRLLRPYPGERSAQALLLPSLDGVTIDLATLRGRVVLVNFWATWCPPCVEEIPSLQRLYRRLRARGLEILAVDVGETRAQLAEFLADKPVEFPVLMDSDGESLRRWGVYAFPTTLVLDRAHRIRYAVFGAFDWSSDEVFATLEPLLQAAAQ